MDSIGTRVATGSKDTTVAISSLSPTGLSLDRVLGDSGGSQAFHEKVIKGVSLRDDNTVRILGESLGSLTQRQNPSPASESAQKPQYSTSAPSLVVWGFEQRDIGTSVRGYGNIESYLGKARFCGRRSTTRSNMRVSHQGPALSGNQDTALLTFPSCCAGDRCARSTVSSISNCLILHLAPNLPWRLRGAAVRLGSGFFSVARYHALH